MDGHRLLSHFLKFLASGLRSSYVISIGLTIVLLAVLTYIVYLVQSDERRTNEPKRIYFADDISLAHRKVIDLFNERHRGSIEVVPIDIPFSRFSTNERKELFARFLRSKSDQIDIFSVDVIWVPRFAKWCESLEKYIPPMERNAILKEALEPCFSRDTLVTIPLFIDVALIYYRRDLLQQFSDAGRLEEELQQSMTWDRFIALCRRFDAKKNPPYIYQADGYEGLLCGFVEMLEDLRAPLVRKGRFELTTPEAVRAASMLRDFIWKYRISPPAVAGFRENNSVLYYLRNDAVFLRGWPSFERDFRTLGPAANVDTSMLRKAPLPRFTGYPPASILGGWNLMISRYSTQKEEAAVFLRFLMSSEAQTILYEDGGFLPTNKSMYEDSTLLQRYRDLQFYGGLLHNGVRRPALVEYTKYSDIISHLLTRVVRRELSPAAALARAAADIDAEEQYERDAARQQDGADE